MPLRDKHVTVGVLFWRGCGPSSSSGWRRRWWGVHLRQPGRHVCDPDHRAGGGSLAGISIENVARDGSLTTHTILNVGS